MPAPRGSSLKDDLRRVPTLVWLLCAATFVNRAGSMVLAFLALYATQELGLSEAQASQIMYGFGIASVAAAIVGGKATDRFGPRRVMLVALAGAGVALLLAAFARTHIALLVAISAWAFLGDAYRPAAISILSTSVAPADRKFAQSLHQVALNLGTTMGSGAGGFLFKWLPVSIYFVDGITSLLAAVVLAVGAARFLKSDGGPATHTRLAPRSGSPAWRDRHLLAVLGASMLVWAVVFQILGPLSLTLVRIRGLGEEQYGTLLGLESLLTVIVAIPLARMTSRWCHYRTLALGALLVGIGMGGYGWALTFGQACALMVAWSFGLILMLPAGTALVAEIAPSGRQGEYAGLFTASFSVAFAAAPGFGLHVLGLFGPEWLFGSCLAVCVVAAAVLLALRREPHVGAADPEAPAEPATALP
ncbi:MAG: MFS transporter [Planctomycetes bacterium]|nr:MFS transporter [Planctomycetota bacterium]